MKTINILTYNTKNNKNDDFFDLLELIINENNIHIMILQEYNESTKLSRLKDFDEITYPKNGDAKWVRILVNKKVGLTYSNHVVHLYNKMICTKILLNSKDLFSLIGVHFYSLLGRSKQEQCIKNIEIPRLIEEYEIAVKSEKTILVGDLNYSMHDISLHSYGFLNAINSKHVINYFGKRDIGRGTTKKYFYNPMWNMLGDYDVKANKEVVPGTFFWIADDADKYYWNLIDGILLRPQIMNQVPVKNIKIITEANDKISGKTVNLLKSKLSKRGDSFIDKKFSDHLPIKFTIKL
jgi:hypothetical protein